jgi:hypothetical protein
VNSCDPEGFALPAPHVTPVVLLLNDTNIIWYGNHGHQITLLITLLVSSSSRPLCCLSYDLRLLITLLVYSNSRPLCCLSYDLRLLITLLVSPNSRPLCCLSYDLRLLITSVVSSNSRPLCCLSYDLRLLITTLVSSIFSWYSEYHHLYIFFICDVYYTYFFLYYLTILGRVYKTM